MPSALSLQHTKNAAMALMATYIAFAVKVFTPGREKGANTARMKGEGGACVGVLWGQQNKALVAQAKDPRKKGEGEEANSRLVKEGGIGRFSHPC